ncbi:MAG: AsmA-like C-terminal domain-containing protein, partial [Campylobacterota bacterium]|nr:AsmA-like C-terminal domain-containing protein [Campylobacterota bacterium]
RIRYGFKFFEFIQLKSVKLKNNHYYINYVDGVLHIVSDEYESVVDIKRHGEILHADISLLYIKKEDITLWGKFDYNMRTGSIDASGEYRAYELNGGFDFTKLDSKVSLRLDANETTSIEKVINRFVKNPKVNEWILDRIETSNYRLDELSASGEIKNGQFKLDLDSIYGLLYAKDIDLYFNKRLKKPIDIETLKLRYQKGSLIFDLSNPRYQDKNITHGHVVIEGLTNKKPYLHLDLALTSRFDKKIAEILEAYRLKIPIFQKSGETNASLYIGVDLKQKAVEVKGDFNLSQGVLKIAKAPLSIQNANISYANKEVHIHKAQLHNDLYDGNVTGAVYIKDKKALLDVDLNQFSIKRKKRVIVELANMHLPLTLRYDKGVEFDIPKLKTQIYTQDSNIIFDFQDIDKIQQYIKVLPTTFDGGHLKLSTKRFKEFKLNGHIVRHDCFLYSKKGQCHTRLPFSGVIRDGGLQLNVFDNKIKLFTKNSTIYASNIHIDLDKMLKSKTKKAKSKKYRDKITILGKNSTIRYKKYQLVTPHYSIDMQGNRTIFSSIDGKRSLFFKKEGKRVLIDAQKIDDKMLHPLINFKSLKGGEYAFWMEGEVNKKIEGKITIDGGMIEKFQAYNNMVAFLNAIPALMTLSNPGFNDKGYRIKTGEIEYSIINQNLIKFKSIKIVGGSSTIVGAGEIDLAKNSINIDLAI